MISLNIFTIIGILVSLLAFYAFKHGKTIDFKLKIKFNKKINVATTALIIILFLGLFSRLYPIMNMNAPLFADPAVEGTIARLIIDNQGIPDTWQPFLPLKLTHQPGFASVVAWFNIISGIPIPRIILFLTNILLGLFPLAIYLLAYRMFKNGFQSIVVSLISLIASFPTYIFIAGMNSGVVAYFLVTLAVAAAIICLHKPECKSLILLFIVSAGALLVHPIFIFFYILMFGSYCLLNILRKFSLKAVKNVSIILFASIFIPILVSMPYFFDILSETSETTLVNEQWNIQADYINPSKIITPLFFIEPIFILFNNISGVWYLYLDQLPIFEILFLYPIAVIMLGFFAYSIYMILKNREELGYLAIFWFLLFVFFSSFQSYFGIRFPGWEFIYPSRVKFLIALPLSLLISFAFLNCRLPIPKKISFESIPLGILILILIVPFGLGMVMGHLSSLSANQPLSDYDISAISWLEKNIGKNEVVLNTITDLEAGAFIGGAGQWIPALAGRSVVFPATSLTEDLSDINIRKRTRIAELMENGTIGGDEFMGLLKEYNVSYVYISKNNMHSRNTFSPVRQEMFFASSNYELKYRNSDVSIFRVKYSQ